MQRSIILGLCLAAFLYYTGMVHARSVPSAEPPREVVQAKLVAANTRFGFKIFRELLKKDDGKNLFISPSSMAFCLAMAYNGAAGTTREAMAKTLELHGLGMQGVNEGSAALREALGTPDPKVRLEIANSLWVRERRSVKPEFLTRNKEHFNAEVGLLDAGADKAINAWVARNTNGKITKMVDKVDPTTVMFLLNAVYFKGEWERQFKPAETKERPFHLLGGKEKMHPMMSQGGKYRYLEGAGFQGVSLPYGTGRISMYLFLPDAKSSLQEFLGKLTPEGWEGWMKGFRERAGSVVLPKFKMEYEATLNNALKALGMEVAFHPKRADFSGITGGRDLFISEVKHKSFVEVNEEGTEAAAATSIEMRTPAGRPKEPPFTMIVDRPFVFAIRDNETKTILFLGAIVDPRA